MCVSYRVMDCQQLGDEAGWAGLTCHLDANAVQVHFVSVPGWLAVL